MALDKQLVLSQNTKQAAPKDAVTARRKRLISRIHNQIEYVQREKEGLLPQRAYRRLARWWWQEPILEQHLGRWRGLSYSEIARRLNAERVPTRGGGKWYPQTVRNYCRGYGWQ